MRIACPHCGPRDLIEFTYQGDANRVRPEPESTDEAAWNSYVYERPNPRGWQAEYWLHHGGCRVHLMVERNTETHEIRTVQFAREASQ
jgi:methylglutamate dehydrogenase subunit B